MPPGPPSIEGPSGLRQIYPPVTLKYPLVQKLIETPGNSFKVFDSSTHFLGYHVMKNMAGVTEAKFM